MHIIYLHQYFNTPQMPGGTRSYEVAKRLVKLGHKVTIITSNRSTESGGWVVTSQDGFDVHWVPVRYSNRMRYLDRIWAFIVFALRSSRRAAGMSGDLIFATSTPLTIAIPGVLGSKKLKVPMVFEVRDLWPEIPIAIGAISNSIVKFLARRLEAWAYANSEAIVALSPGMREGVLKTGYDSRRVAVIPNGSDNSEFTLAHERREAWRARRSWLGSRPLLTYPGTFGKINGVGYLIPIAERLRTIAPDVRILLIGDGAERELIRAQAIQAGVFEVNLFMEDSVPKAEMPDVFAGSDMICSLVINVPALFSNSANKLFDAFAAGKPVLINHGGWQAEMIENMSCGVVTANLNSEESAELIAGKITDEVWRTAAGLASKYLAIHYFDRDRLVSNLNSVLLAAVERRGSEVSSITG